MKVLFSLIFLFTVTAQANPFAQKVRSQLDQISKKLRSQGLPADVFVTARVGFDVNRATVLNGSIETVVDHLIDQRDEETYGYGMMDQLSDFISNKELLYSHAGFIAKDTQGQYKVYHLLGIKGVLRIFSDTLEQFFNSGTRAKALIVPLKAHVQNRVLGVLGKDLGQSLLSNRYNLVALPYDSQDQNSTQYVTEIIGAALSPQPTRAAAFDYLKKANYQPTLMHVQSYKLSLGSTFHFFLGGLNTSKQYGRGGYGNIFYFNTVLSLRELLQRQGLSTGEYHIK